MTARQTEDTAALALLPGLQYLASEAKHAGLHKVSDILIEAMVRISLWVEEPNTADDELPGERSPPSTPRRASRPPARRGRRAA